MLFSDLIWFVGSYFGRFKLKASDPRAHYLIVEGDIRLRVRRTLFVMLVLFLLPYGLASLEGLSGGSSFGPARLIVLVMWCVCLGGYLVVSFALPRVRRALVAHAALAAAPLPIAISFLSVGTQVLAFGLGSRALFVLPIAIAVTGLVIWGSSRSSRPLANTLLRKREYRRLLRNQVGNWSPAFVVENSASGTLGCLAIGLSVIAPAIGMHLDDMVGRRNANTVMGVLGTYLGVLFLHAAGSHAASHLIAMRALEVRIGRSLTLPPYGEDTTSRESHTRDRD